MTDLLWFFLIFLWSRSLSVLRGMQLIRNYLSKAFFTQSSTCTCSPFRLSHSWNLSKEDLSRQPMQRKGGRYQPPDITNSVAVCSTRSNRFKQ